MDDKFHVTVVTQDGLVVTMLGLCQLHSISLLNECPETTFQSMCVTSETGEEMGRWHKGQGYSHDMGRTWCPTFRTCVLSALSEGSPHPSTMEH